MTDERAEALENFEENLVQCEVTGKMVNPDDIVEIQGKKVCAEGKDILLDNLKSGALLDGELSRPTVMRRFGCILVDNIILGLFTIIIALIFGFSMIAKDGSQSTAISSQHIIYQIAMAIITISYFAIFHSLFGKTPGKMTGKIKVVNLDGSKISGTTAVLRSLYFAGPNLIQALLLAIVGKMAIIASLITIAIGIYAIANVIFALVDKDMQRALHDRLAGTRVIITD